MRCSVAHRLISDRIDDELEPSRADELEQHLTACESCRTFAERLVSVRRQVQLQPAGRAPDVVPRVLARLEQRPTAPAALVARREPARRSSPWPAAAAVFLVAAVVAAGVVGVDGPRDAEAIDASSLVAAGQRELQALAATVEVVEHGWHRDVPVRTYRGTLDYAAPERLRLRLDDRTAYPSGDWHPNDVDLVVDGDQAWGAGRAGCAPNGLPGCLSSVRRVEAVRDRAPFDPAAPVPLDLVLPVASFLVGGAEQPLGEAEVAGRAAVGVEVTAAQIAPLLDGLARHGNWRPVHPTDRALVWLDADVGLPLLVEVRANGGFERDRWAAANGLADGDGEPVLSWRLDQVDLDPADPALPEPPSGVQPRSLGFVAGQADGPEPGWLPEGMQPHRSGRVGSRTVTSYAHGRAWLTVQSTSDWAGTRLFGHASRAVQSVGLGGGGGVAYVPEGGDRVLIHGDGIDVEVAGSLPTGDLLRVAASLGVTGLPVPDDWDEAGSVTLTELGPAWAGLLTLPEDRSTYVGPGVAHTETEVLQTFAGAGDRGFVISQVVGDTLGPPVDAVVLAVDVRDRSARYTPDRGTLEWVEDGRIVTLRSRTLGLEELVRLAAALEPTG
jgi:hypothetical protein